jgi:hypothetical protein
MRNIVKILLLIIILFLTDAYSQQFDIRRNSFYLPGETEEWRFRHLMGVAAIKIPEEIIEDETSLRAPLLYYRINLGLPANFLFKSSVETNIITFHFEGGLGWNFLLDKLSFSPEVKASYWTGRLKQYGFDSRMSGVDVTTGLSGGYSFGKYSITLKSELFYQISNTIKAGDVTVSRDPQKFNGYANGIYIEQPLWKDNVIVVGFRYVLVELYYPVWVAFSTFKRRFHVTEATVGLIL